MTRSATALARLLLAGATLVASEAAAAAPPAPVRWVTDTAGFLSEAARRSLDGRLEAYQRRTGHHVLVWIAPTTGGVPVEEFTVRAFAAWQVGRKGLDDGVVLFVFSEDRRVRLEVGYGLEGQVPDAVASRIISEIVIPGIRAGDRDGAVQDGVEAVVAAIEGGAGALDPGAGSAAPRRRPGGGARSLGPVEKVLIGILVLGFLFLLATNPALALSLLQGALLSGRGGGHYGGGGGGGYRGGGGRSGGGGASGSW